MARDSGKRLNPIGLLREEIRDLAGGGLARWRWRDDVCDRLSVQVPLWAEWVRCERAPVGPRRVLLSVGAVCLGGWYEPSPDGSHWVVVYDGWMVCARRGDPLQILWHAPLEGGPRVTTRHRHADLELTIGAASPVEVTVETRTPFTFSVFASQVDGLLSAIASATRPST